jgi:hypothetical protein
MPKNFHVKNIQKCASTTLLKERQLRILKRSKEKKKKGRKKRRMGEWKGGQVEGREEIRQEGPD